MGEFAQRVPAGDADYILSRSEGLQNPRRKASSSGQEVTVHIYNDEREDTGLHLTTAE